MKFDSLIQELSLAVGKKKLSKVMPKGKVKHSLRVAKKLRHLPEFVQDAAAYHDFLERGGNIKWLKKKLDPQSVNLIEYLTADDEATPLEHLKDVISKVDSIEMKNFVLLIKLADRRDNYQRRVITNSLTKKYKKKTKKLLEFIYSNYSGNKGDLKQIV